MNNKYVEIACCEICGDINIDVFIMYLGRI
jgi:hypothetical protein